MVLIASRSLALNLINMSTYIKLDNDECVRHDNIHRYPACCPRCFTNLLSGYRFPNPSVKSNSLSDTMCSLKPPLAAASCPALWKSPCQNPASRLWTAKRIPNTGGSIVGHMGDLQLEFIDYRI